MFEFVFTGMKHVQAQAEPESHTQLSTSIPEPLNLQQGILRINC